MLRMACFPSFIFPNSKLLFCFHGKGNEFMPLVRFHGMPWVWFHGNIGMISWYGGYDFILRMKSYPPYHEIIPTLPWNHTQSIPWNLTNGMHSFPLPWKQTDNLLLGNIKQGKQVILNIYALFELFGRGL